MLTRRHQKFQVLSADPAYTTTTAQWIVDDFRSNRDNHEITRCNIFSYKGRLAVFGDSEQFPTKVTPALFAYLLRNTYQFQDAAGRAVDMPEAVAAAVVSILAAVGVLPNYTQALDVRRAGR